MASAGLSLVSIKGDFADVLEYVDVKTQSTTFAYGGTLGLVFSKHVNLGFKYIGSNPAFSDYKPSVSTLQATIGYQF